MIESSHGEPVLFPSGETYCFKRTRSYSHEELRDWENAAGIVLPEEYRAFLLEIGACVLFYGGSTEERGIYIYALDEIYGFYKNCFDEPDEFLFGKLLPVAGDENLQEIGGFAMQKEPPINFAAFWHEENPEEWIELTDDSGDWQTFASWLQTVVEHEGRRPL